MRFASTKSLDARVAAARSPLAPREPALWRIASVHPHALHMVDASGDRVLSIGDARAVPLPTQWRLASASAWWHGATPGTSVLHEGDEVTWRSDDGSLRTVHAVRTWRPSRVTHSPDTTLLSRVPNTLVTTEGSSLDGDIRLTDFADALAARTGVTASARALVGLGEGLTPAGDDAICGMVLGARACGVTMSDHHRHDLVSLTRGRTTALSASCIAAALDGYAVADVVNLVHDFTRGRWDSPSLERVLAMGHSSGRDLIAGLIAWLRRFSHT